MIIQITPTEIEEINKFANELFIEVYNHTKNFLLKYIIILKLKIKLQFYML